MRKFVISVATLALVSCNKPAPVDNTAANSAVFNEMATTNDMMANDMAAGNNMAASNMASPAAFDIKHTSWEFKDPTGKPIQESVDENGNYVSHSGATHIDHGTAVMKDGKACFTSKMDKKGEICWTVSPVDVGGAMATTSDKGDKLTVNRVAYTPPKM